MADDLVLDSNRSAVRFEAVDGRLVVTVDVDDDFYSHDWTLTMEQCDQLSALIAQTPTRL